MTLKKTALIASLFMMCVALFVFMLMRPSDSPSKSIGTVRLNVETYRAGKNQPTHPSVVVFPEAWNGAKYWLAYSPYPYHNGEEENPCLAVSDDMLYWETPLGLANPIADNEETGCDELKDPHLLYRADLDRLEMWYLGRLAEHLGGDGKSLLLMRKCSYDGVNWSEYEVMASTKYLSPTIFWDGTKYVMWGIGYDLWNTTGTIAYQESVDGFTWSEPILCSMGSKDANIDIWHGAVTEQDGTYHFVFIDNSDRQEVFYCTSTDGIHFSEPEIIVENKGFWKHLYRPALAFDGDEVFCLYGVVNQAGQWFISMSQGTNQNDLVGIGEAETAEMYQLSDKPINTDSLRYKLSDLYDLIQRYLRLELLALAIFEALLILLIRKIRNKTFLTISIVANLLLSFAYICVRMLPGSGNSWLGAIIAVCCLNFGMAAVLQCMVLFCNQRKNT